MKTDDFDFELPVVPAKNAPVEDDLFEVPAKAEKPANNGLEDLFDEDELKSKKKEKKKKKKLFFRDEDDDDDDFFDDDDDE